MNLQTLKLEPAEALAATVPPDAPERADRRIQRTRRMLNEAILALIVEQPYDSISIRDITERADVNRATFYHHYQSKDELLTAALAAQFDTLVANFDALPCDNGLFYDPVADVLTFQHIQEYAALYRVLLGEQGPGHIVFRMTAYVAEICRRLIERTGSVEALAYPLDPVSHHMASSIVGLARWWLVNDMPCSVEEIADMSHALCIFGIAGTTSTSTQPSPPGEGAKQGAC